MARMTVLSVARARRRALRSDGQRVGEARALVLADHAREQFPGRDGLQHYWLLPRVGAR